MPSARRRLSVLLAVLASVGLLASGCARLVAMDNPEPSETYTISIRNDTPVVMLVRYNDGRGDALLGTVAAGATERFVIAAPASMTISVRGTATSGGREAGPYTVTLTSGTPQSVILQ